MDNILNLLSEYQPKKLQSLVIEASLAEWDSAREEVLRLVRSDNWSQYFELFKQLPDFKAEAVLNEAFVKIGKLEDLDPVQQTIVQNIIKILIPWRKGPYKIFGNEIDAEWRSDYKWDRLAPHVTFKNKRILDIGCNNGYYMFRAAAENPELVLGIDPIDRFFLTFQFVQKFLKIENLHFEPVGIQHLGYLKPEFDLVLLMGILYHRRDPIQSLRDLKKLFRAKGELLLETMVIPGEESYAFCNPDRYCQMHNVYLIPTVTALKAWLKKAGYKDIEVLDVSRTGVNEQRQTLHAPYLSLDSFLDKDNSELTIEGHPAPLRAVIFAKT